MGEFRGCKDIELNNTNLFLQTKRKANFSTHGRSLLKQQLPEKDLNAVTQHWTAQKVGTGFGGKPEVGVKIETLLARVKP